MVRSQMQLYRLQVFILRLVLVFCTSAYADNRTQKPARPFHSYCSYVLRFFGIQANQNYPALEVFQSEKWTYRTEVSPTHIPDGTLVEGSINARGIQPHYKIDLSHPALKSYLEFAKTLKGKNISIEEKIKLLTKETKRLLPGRGYFNFTYLNLLERHSKSNTPVSLGDYLDAKVGTCRENALLMNLALQEAGIPSKFHYLNIQRSMTLLGKVSEDHAFNTVVVNGKETIVDSFFADLNGVPLAEFRIKKQVIGKKGTVEFVKFLHFPKFSIPHKVKSDASFQLIGAGNRTLNFHIKGRESAERSFDQENERYRNAGPDEEVDVEWIFSPFYVPLGHSTLRIGNKSYEFTKKGWEVHTGGKDSARAFLFNNPFFKKQYEKYKDKGMAPFSVGIPIKIKKAHLEKFQSNIQNGSAKEEEFSLIFNNCNQCLLKNMGPDFVPPNAFEYFSSVLTFRKLMLSSTGPMNVYALPGVGSYHRYQNLMPEYLYKDWSHSQEQWRVLNGWIQQLKK